MKKAIIIHAAKVALTAGALAAALTGCCMFGGKKDCCGRSCCSKDACCPSACCDATPCCDEQKTHGVNTSMTVGLGTDGVHAGGAANVGSYGVSGGVNGDMH